MRTRVHQSFLRRLVSAIVFVMWGPESHSRCRYNAQVHHTWWF